MDNFQETVLAFAPAAETKTVPTANGFAVGVLEIKLCGPIGSGKPISLESVRRQIVARNFDHLHIEISSSGGSPYEAFAIYDFVRALPVPVSARAVGQCLSAGMIVFMAADFRSASADTEFLLHPASFQRDVLPDRVTKQVLREHGDRLAATDSRLAGLFANRTGWPAVWFATEIETEDTLEVPDAITTGLVHQFDGFTPAVDSRWPEIAKQVAADRDVYFPRYLFTQAYFAACRCAATLYPASDEGRTA